MEGSWIGTRARSNGALEADGLKPVQKLQEATKMFTKELACSFGSFYIHSRKEYGRRKLVLGGRVAWNPSDYHKSRRIGDHSSLLRHYERVNGLNGQSLPSAL